MIHEVSTNKYSGCNDVSHKKNSHSYVCHSIGLDETISKMYKRIQ